MRRTRARVAGESHRAVARSPVGVLLFALAMLTGGASAADLAPAASDEPRVAGPSRSLAPMGAVGLPIHEFALSTHPLLGKPKAKVGVASWTVTLDGYAPPKFEHAQLATLHAQQALAPPPSTAAQAMERRRIDPPEVWGPRSPQQLPPFSRALFSHLTCLSLSA